MNKKILYLTLKKHWFDLMARGIKTEEFREIKDYWHQKGRFFENDEDRKLFKPIQYDEVHITNGYGAGKPFLRIKWLGLDATCTPQNDEPLNGALHYRIKLGEILELRNWSEAA